MLATKYSLDLVQEISKKINDKTFHHHYHILYDIPVNEPSVYLEIGCYAGASAILMLQRPRSTVITVDLGYPISKDIAIKNISVNNPYNNVFNYIEGNSHDISIFEQVKSLSSQVDILFIDGDHTYNGVIKDYYMYEKLVKSGGYIVFDDYNDRIHSPEVKTAVTYIVDNVKNINIIGTIDNCLGARPNTLLNGNCFVVQKK